MTNDVKNTHAFACHLDVQMNLVRDEKVANEKVKQKQKQTQKKWWMNSIKNNLFECQPNELRMTIEATIKILTAKREWQKKARQQKTSRRCYRTFSRSLFKRFYDARQQLEWVREWTSVVSIATAASAANFKFWCLFYGVRMTINQFIWVKTATKRKSTHQSINSTSIRSKFILASNQLRTRRRIQKSHSNHLGERRDKRKFKSVLKIAW